jgi:branched-chain amino acid transport system substrate-binding protein
MIDISHDYSLSRAHTFMDHFIARGGNIVSVTYCQSTDSQLTAQIAAIVAAKPDILYLPINSTQIIAVCRRAAESNLRIPIISFTKVLTPAFIDAGKEAVEGIIIPGVFAREAVYSDTAKRFLDIYEQETGEAANTVQILAADTYFLLADAIERAQSPTGHNIQKALSQARNVDLLSGKLTIDEHGNALRNVVFYQITAGKFTYLPQQITPDIPETPPRPS